MWRDQLWWFRDARHYGIVIVLLLAVIGAFIAVPDFNTEENLGNVVTQSAALGVLAIGQTFVCLRSHRSLSRPVTWLDCRA